MRMKKQKYILCLAVVLLVIATVLIGILGRSEMPEDHSTGEESGEVAELTENGKIILHLYEFRAYYTRYLDEVDKYGVFFKRT